VWSIAMGLLLGFIINIFSSVYYGLFITGDLQWSQVNHQQILWCALALIALVGYLMFFIADYPNTFEFSKAYWKRYQRYFFYSFWPGKIIRWIIGFYLLLFLLSLLILIYYFMILGLGGLYGTIAFVGIMTLTYVKERLTKKHV
jgi:hypothetical protein